MIMQVNQILTNDIIQLIKNQETISKIGKMSQLQIFKKYIKEDYRQHLPKLKYKTNFTNCILQNFQNRKYQKTQQDDWDIIWSQKEFIPQIYEKKLLPHQRVNHFKNYYQLCKKDSLVRNLKKHRKTLERQGNIIQAKQYYFFPQTFVLPSQYVLFVDEFKKNINNPTSNVWIMKPTGKSQGKGIFIINKLNQTSQWQNNTSEPYIIQKYINDPLLIGGKKFDIRLYVLVTSYNPLTVYLYRDGFARFTHSRYDQSNINDIEAHLTNVAIQKFSENYDENLGGKWYLNKLKSYLQSKYGYEETENSFMKIQTIILKTLEGVAKVMTSGSNQKQNSFELYGFDILLDKNLNPWLIQVNGSPSMTANTKVDYDLKIGLLDDTLAVLNIEKLISGKQDQVGGFDLISNKCFKTKNGKSQKIKTSFLGSFNNREQNYKKIAKLNSNFMNQNMENLIKQKQAEKEREKQSNMISGISNRQSYPKKVMVQSNKDTLISTPNNLTQKNLSKSRKQVPSSPGTSVSIRHQSQTNDFIIKKKIVRQVTNENEHK